MLEIILKTLPFTSTSSKIKNISSSREAQNISFETLMSLVCENEL